MEIGWTYLLREVLGTTNCADSVGKIADTVCRIEFGKYATVSRIFDGGSVCAGGLLHESKEPMRQPDLKILLHEGEGSMLEYNEPTFTGKAFFPATFRPCTAQVPRKYRTSHPTSTQQATLQVAAMLEAAREPRTRAQLQKVTGLKDRPHFIKTYLEPVLANGWLEMTIPGKPRSPKQKYRTTELGLKVLRERENDAS